MHEETKGRRRWRPRFSLRTLVVGVLIYAGLWTATEIWGGRAFRERIESQTEDLRRATLAWNRSQADEAAFWQDQGYFFPAGEETHASTEGTQEDRPPLGVPDVPGGKQNSPLVPQLATAFCDVETSAVAPFILRVQYTSFCVDGYGRSLPVSEEGAPLLDRQGWIFWCFGYSWMPELWK